MAGTDDSGARTKSNIPAELRKLPRWVAWQLGASPGGSPTKKPVGSTRRPNEWQPLDALFPQGLPNSDERGAGLVLTGGVQAASGGYVIGLDLDACVHDDGSLSPWAQEVLKAYPSFTEYSPSRRGLHVLLRTATLPAPLSLIRVPADAPPGVDKVPQIQVFGCGPAGYLTCTGDRVHGTPPKLNRFANLAWLEERFGVGAFGDPSDPADLPEGTGDAPTLDEIDATLQRSPDIAALIAGDWEGRFPSASEGWWQLSRAALRAARSHGSRAATYLLTRTAYGRGEVDSRDPARYTRREWVERDLGRMASKSGEAGANVFDDGFDVEHYELPKRIAPPDTGPWVLPFADFRLRRTARRFLYKNFLPARGLAQIFGDPSSGKTPFAVSLAVHVAAGLPWFGHQLKRPGSVVYMIGEDEAGIIDRVTAQLLAVDPLMSTDVLPLFSTTRPGQLITPENRQRWVTEVNAALQQRHAPPLALLIVDTQNRNFGPGNENDTEDMTAFVEQLDALGRQLDALILLVHHTGHTNKERGRGSSVLFAALDACFEVQRDGMNVVLSARKSKNWADPQPIVARMEVVTLGRDEDGEPETAITLATERQALPDASVFEGVEEGMAQEAPVDPDLLLFLRHVGKLQGRKVSQAQLAEATGCTRATVRYWLDVTGSQGLIMSWRATPRTAPTFALTEKGKRMVGSLDDVTEAPAGATDGLVLPDALQPKKPPRLGPGPNLG